MLDLENSTVAAEAVRRVQDMGDNIRASFFSRASYGAKLIFNRSNLHSAMLQPTKQRPDNS